jgi:hypothetical protein
MMKVTKTFQGGVLWLFATSSCLLMLLACSASAQETQPSPSPSPSAMPKLSVAIKLKVYPYGKDANNQSIPVARKHFYLFNKKIEKETIENLQVKLGNMPSHKDYQLKSKVSDAFIKDWLEKYRCDTVYCRDITQEDLKIPELNAAYTAAQKVFGDKRDEQGNELALKWMVNFLPKEVRTGYYDMKTEWLNRATKMLKDEMKAPVATVATNKAGEAYFTNIDPLGGEPDVDPKTKEKPGTIYYITNLVPIETADNCFLWLVANKVGPNVPVTQFDLRNPSKTALLDVKTLKGNPATALSFKCK